MTERTYPYTAWVLLPSFKPKEVELVSNYRSFSADYGDLAESGKLYALGELFQTKADAVEEGWKRVDKQQGALNKQMQSIKKKREQLLKAKQEIES